MEKNRIVFRPSLASLELQMSIYYNAIFSFMFLLVIMTCSVQKAMYYGKLVSISVITLWSVVEPFRLYYGWRGNLREKVPELATYLLISIFPQLPFVLYLAFIQPVLFPIDKIFGSIMFIFLMCELYFGIQSIRQQIRSQTSQFMRLCQQDELSLEEEDDETQSSNFERNKQL